MSCLLLPHARTIVLAAASLLASGAVGAATTFSLDRAQASVGETVEIVAVYINDTNTASNWTPAQQLVLQWRGPSGKSVRSLAYLAGEASPATVPVNNFTKVSWRAVVPPGVKGLQAIAVEGEPTLMALDTSPLEAGPVAGTPAVSSIVDAGVPGESVGTGEPLPAVVTAGLGVESKVGEPANAAKTAPNVQYTASTWEHVRNALSPHDPVYFVFGGRDGLDSRFQISFKYRFFQPESGRPAAFHENLYLGYTQTSLWDLDSDSKPFYDTTYNPSLMWKSDKVWESADKHWSVGLASGLDHRSNGQDEEESRSVNSVFAQPVLNYRLDNGSTISFAPKVHGYFGLEDQNSDYADYMGRVDWNLQWAKDDGVMVAGLLRQGKGGRNSVQVDLAWPLRRTFLSNMNGYLHFQYFQGYGQTLISYDKRVPAQFRVGLMIVR